MKLKNILICTFIIASIAIPVSGTEGKTAVKTQSNLKINNNIVDMDSYNIDGYNYFKLRDVAYSLNNTGNSFSINFDSNTNSVYIRNNEKYTSTGGEMANDSDNSPAFAVKSETKIYVDDQFKEVEGYNIKGNNYFKLRSLGELTGFNVVWNEDKNTIEIETKDEIDWNSPVSPQKYQQLLGKGMDVDWSKTSKGKDTYSQKMVKDFKDAGISHVRIRVKDEADENLFKSLDKQIDDCIENGLIPVLAYQADEMKNDPSKKNIKKVAKWWSEVAGRYKDKSYMLSFDLIIEVTDELNDKPETLNEIYEELVSEVRKTNPERIIMIYPRVRSDAQYLQDLKIPSKHNNYLMAEWHFYASGPSKTNDRKLWTTGTLEEKQKVLDKINLAKEWSSKTGIPTWVGAWMPGNYNDGNDYSIEEQVVFAKFVSESLYDAGIPFAVNSDTKFYDSEGNKWIEDMKPVFDCIFR